jgi:beta-1,4-N-acetylglucosaminyltransferase
MRRMKSEPSHVPSPGAFNASSPVITATPTAVDLLIVCSSGGHLLQMHALQQAWHEFSRVWVTFNTTDVRSLLADETVVFAHAPTNRHIGNLVRNLLLAIRVVRRVRPKVVLTTGAGVAVPLCWVGRLYGARVVYVESLTRIGTVSLSCRLIRPVASRIYVQWDELRSVIPSARYAGSVLED